jgi:hypothetical protein
MAGETLTPQRSFDGRRFTYRDAERFFSKPISRHWSESRRSLTSQNSLSDLPRAATR